MGAPLLLGTHDDLAERPVPREEGVVEVAEPWAWTSATKMLDFLFPALRCVTWPLKSNSQPPVVKSSPYAQQRFTRRIPRRRLNPRQALLPLACLAEEERTDEPT